jgi:hypothetical protein
LAAKTAAAIGAEVVEAAHYEAHRIACGAPAGGVDFRYGDAFPHEANMDRLHGVDFSKGCYVGQEVVSRMQHRGTARTRTVRIAFDGVAPVTGSEMFADDKSIGHLGSIADGQGLALVRIDKLADAVEAGERLHSGEIALRLLDPVEVPKPAVRMTL